MTITIAHEATVLFPTLVLGFRSERQSGNIVHPIIGRGDPDITFREAGLRKGTLRIFCPSWTSALEVEALHILTGKFLLNDDTNDLVNMTYVPAGTITTEYQDESPDCWIVSVDFQEVL